MKAERSIWGLGWAGAMAAATRPTAGRVTPASAETPAATPMNAGQRTQSGAWSSGQHGAAGVAAAGGNGTGVVTGDGLSAVLGALESEAWTLRRANHIARSADGVLIEAGAMLGEAEALDLRLANPRGLSSGEAAALTVEEQAIRAAGETLVGNATFEDRPLFDGSVRLRVGGGSLTLPDLRSPPPGSLQSTALGAVRLDIGRFTEHTLGPRLRMVDSSLQHTLAARALIRDADDAPRLDESPADAEPLGSVTTARLDVWA